MCAVASADAPDEPAAPDEPEPDGRDAPAAFDAL
jgi:hypothetical protein